MSASADALVTPPLVLYHANCVDGWASAWVADCALSAPRDGVCTRLEPCRYDTALSGRVLDMVPGAEVFLVDFSLPTQTILALLDLGASKVVIIDHHERAFREHLAPLVAELPGLVGAVSPVEVVFDAGRSGAGLCWDWFCRGSARPWIVDYVEDHDLWRHALPRSRAVNAAIASYPFELSVWDELSARALDDVADEGAAILRYQTQVLEAQVARARGAVLLGHAVPVVNATTLISETGNVLAQHAPFAAVWAVLEDGRVKYSLRSDAAREDAADVAELAARFGGGGHRHAAGFTVDRLVHERGA